MDSSIVAQISAPAPYAKGRRIFGAGLNDVSHAISANGKNLKTYNVWYDMLRRCYSARYQELNPTYVGCTVDPDWLRFSVFEQWMLIQDYEAKSLDKDILFPGNKVYSPTTCVFIPQSINTILGASKAARGAYPLGVCYRKDRKKYGASIHKEGSWHHLGFYDTVLEAHHAWQLSKSDAIAKASTDDLRVRIALDKRVTKLREDAASGRITETI